MERAILASAKVALNTRNLKMDDILEWSTSETAVKKNLRDGEVMLPLEDMGVWVAVKREKDMRVVPPNDPSSATRPDGAGGARDNERKTT
jgi:hypothetical protein